MRVYHFVSEEHGLDDLRRQRLKIATLNELNDPFELFGVNLADPAMRHAFRRMKDELATNRGLLCFSENWSNPVQWSHYAAKHSGLCLGFDVPDHHLERVSYSRKRLVVAAEALHSSGQLDVDTVKRFLFTKYSHWRYENEVRCFVSLEDRDPTIGLYFADFSESLRLTTVIVGSRSSVSRATLNEAIGQSSPGVETFKVRLAFNTFKVVRQRDTKLWT